MVLSQMIYFSLQKACLPFRWKTRWTVRSCQQTTFFGAPWMLLPSVVHVSSTFEFGAVFHDCLSADTQGNPPFSPFFFAAPWMSFPSAVHVFSIIKCEASGYLEARYSVVFQIGSFAKYVYMCISVLYSLFWLLFVFCFVQKKKKK